MLEIYNENVRDLLHGAGDKSRKAQQTQQQPLKVRQSPKYGFYVEGLKVVPVESYHHIKSLMEQGGFIEFWASFSVLLTLLKSVFIRHLHIYRLYM